MSTRAEGLLPHWPLGFAPARPEHHEVILQNVMSCHGAETGCPDYSYKQN